MSAGAEDDDALALHRSTQPARPKLELVTEPFGAANCGVLKRL